MQHNLDTIVGGTNDIIVGRAMDIDAGRVNMDIIIEAGEVKRLCGSKILYDGFDW